MPADVVSEPREYVTVEAYLESERDSEVRHEYLAGEVYAMAGASTEHEVVAGNFFAALHSHLKGSPCQVFKDGMKLRLPAMGEDVFYYPDVMVACDPADNHRYYRTSPKLLIEVLSENVNKDLVEKYFAYQHIASVEEYVVVKPDAAQPEVRIFRRSEGWQLGERYSEGEFTLRSVGLTVKVADLYAR